MVRSTPFMFFVPRSVYPIGVLIALVPGAISWWSGRRLARRLDDAALPELLVEHRRRNGAMFGVLIVAIGWLTVESDGSLILPLILYSLVAYLGFLAAAYPLRRALYRETWTFSSYCLFYPRATIGLFAFWLLALVLPGLAALGGEYDWLIASVLGVLLVAWNMRKEDVVRWALRTQPLPAGELLDGCRALADVCGLPQTRFERIELRGGVVVNALALPSATVPSVLFTDTLLERFDRSEILAICAHELAHFDHYTPARVRRTDIENYALIALGVVAAPGARGFNGEWGIWLGTLWLMIIVATMALRARGKQLQETHCDLRAVALTGDAEAVIRGLTKLYTIARIPRRLDQQTEQSSTHPSLARRIRDIRKAAGFAPASLTTARSFTSADDRTVVTFDESGLQWTERDAVTHVLTYGHLRELRVMTRTGRGPRLVAVGAEARRWEMSPCPGDIAAIQEVLDVVDGRLADPQRARALPRGVRRALVVTAAMITLTFSQLAVCLVALLAWIRPSTPLLAGAGLAAEAAAALVLRDDRATEYLIASSLPLAVMGLALLAFAWSHRRTPREGLGPVMAILAAFVGCTLLVVISNGFDVVRLHRSVRGMPSLTVFLVALAGALACFGTPRARLGGVAATILALVTAAVASTPFLDRFANDPFVVDAPPVRWVSLHANPVQAFDVPFNTSRIRLSPNGRYVAVYQAGYDGEHAATVQVGRLGNPLASIQADDVAFVGDDQLLTVRSDGQDTRLETTQLSAPSTAVWGRTVKNLSSPALSLDASNGRWRLLGWENDKFILRVEGIVGGAEVNEQRWAWGPGDDVSVEAMTSAGPAALVVETHYDRNLLARMLSWQWSWAQMVLPASRASRYGMVTDRGLQTLGESELDVDCFTNVMPEMALACTAYDGSRTRIVTISPATRRVEAVGLIDGHFVTNQIGADGWLTGWLGSHPVAVRLSTGEAFVPPRGRIVRLMPVAVDRLAALVVAVDHFAAVVYAPFADAPSEDTVAERLRQIPPSLR